MRVALGAISFVLGLVDTSSAMMIDPAILVFGFVLPVVSFAIEAAAKQDEERFEI